MFRRIILTLLASLPMGIVSFAAKSAAQDLNDQDSVRDLHRDLDAYRPLIFENGVMSSTVKDSLERYNQQMRSTNRDLSEMEFLVLLDNLETLGFLQRKGEFILAKTPSIMG